ncbi:hypothetical protein FH972_023827 [Carpinus fangiana]|uniref:Uncharacterized protein n=1 Tax=Carpinus fangiana TaxID=176857 RepID=A0A5N6KWB9_9ROSI|nr:hypothetical protein FH972_023827 [Carpinus fangiana]
MPSKNRPLIPRKRQHSEVDTIGQYRAWPQLRWEAMQTPQSFEASAQQLALPRYHQPHGAADQIAHLDTVYKADSCWPCVAQSRVCIQVGDSSCKACSKRSADDLWSKVPCRNEKITDLTKLFIDFSKVSMNDHSAATLPIINLPYASTCAHADHTLHLGSINVLDSYMFYSAQASGSKVLESSPVQDLIGIALKCKTSRATNSFYFSRGPERSKNLMFGSSEVEPLIFDRLLAVQKFLETSANRTSCGLEHLLSLVVLGEFASSLSFAKDQMFRRETQLDLSIHDSRQISLYQSRQGIAMLNCLQDLTRLVMACCGEFQDWTEERDAIRKRYKADYWPMLVPEAWRARDSTRHLEALMEVITIYREIEQLENAAQAQFPQSKDFGAIKALCTVEKTSLSSRGQAINRLLATCLDGSTLDNAIESIEEDVRHDSNLSSNTGRRGFLLSEEDKFEIEELSKKTSSLRFSEFISMSSSSDNNPKSLTNSQSGWTASSYASSWANHGRNLLHPRGPDTEIEEDVRAAPQGRIDEEDINGQTQLSRAAKAGFVREIKALLERDADPLKKDKFGSTPLHYSIIAPTPFALECLLRYCGPNLDVRNERGCHILHLALEKQKDTSWLDTIYMSMTDADKKSVSWDCLIQETIRTDQLISLNWLVDKMADLQIKVHDDMLLLAAQYQSGAFCEVLFKAGAAINSRGHDEKNSGYGCTPLIMAVKGMQEDAMRWLIEHGADVNAENASGLTALHYASELWYSSPVYIQCLSQAGANLDARTKCDETPLMHAIQADSCGPVRWLLQAGANIHLKDNRGRGALQQAFKRQYIAVDIVQVLLENMAIIEVGKTSQNTLLHYAARSMKPGLFYLLRPKVLDGSIDPYARNLSGQTAIDIAIQAKSCSQEGFKALLECIGLLEPGMDIGDSEVVEKMQDVFKDKFKPSTKKIMF